MNPIHRNPPLSEAEMQELVDETNHAIATSYIHAALATEGLRPEVRHHLELAMTVHNLPCVGKP